MVSQSSSTRMPQQTTPITHPSSTHLSGFLSTNAPPGALEAASIHQGSIIIQDKISQLRSRLGHLEGLLQDHRRVLSTIRRIPTEVWGRIFTFVLPFCTEGFNKRELLQLALVCKAWYQAVRVTHGLWSQYVADTHPPSFEAAKSWLSRSGNVRPKSLEVHCSQAHQDTNDTCTITHSEVVKVLAEGPELNHLFLRCQTSLCIQRLSKQIPPSQWGPIEILNLHFKSRGSDSEEDFISNFLDIPSSVTSLTIDLGYWWDRYWHRYPICFSPSVYERLTSFSFNSAAWESGGQFLRAVQHLTSLEKLTISFIRSWWLDWDRVTTPVSLPCLRTLHLIQAQEFTLLESLMLPALTELVVRGEDADKDPSTTLDPNFRYSWPHPELQCPNLRVFRLYSPPVHPYRLASTLRHLPHLTELTLSGVISEERPDDADLDAYQISIECSCHQGGNVDGPETQWTCPMWAPPMHDVFQILHSWDLESKASPRNMPCLQVLEILNLPADYDFTCICSYLQGRLEKPPPPALASEDTLKRLIVTFRASRLPDNCNIQNFRTVHEGLEKIGIRTSITPSALNPSKRPSSNTPWDDELYPFNVDVAHAHAS
ncbi:hypothetical protein MD484_g4519, partial [Candolleomyces efflorescens]